MENQQLLDYIKQQLQQGVDRETIKNSLTAQGWQQSDLDQAFLQAQSKNTVLQSEILPQRNHSRMKKFFIIAGIILVLVIGVLWYIGLLDFGYYFVKETLAPTKQEIPSTANDQVVPKKILEHKTSFSMLGINFQKENGNSADIYITLAGTFEKPGTWSEKYKGKKEEEIFLDSNDINTLLQMASREKFSLYPEHFSLPTSPLDFPKLQLPSLNTIRAISRRVIATAKQLEEQGKKAEAEKLIQSLITIGRQFEDSVFNTQIQWLVGIAVEKTGAEGLRDFYQRNGDIAKSSTLNSYAQEVDAMKQQFSSWTEKSTKNMIVATALYAATRDYPSPNRAFVRAFYQKLETTEAEFQTWLDSVKAADDPIIQMDMILPMIMLKNANGLEPERSMAEAVLRQYAKSGNPYVAEYSQKALNISSEQIIQWFKDNENLNNL